MITNKIEIPAGSDYYLYFNSDDLTLEGQEIEPYSSGLSEKVVDAIAKSPIWIQRRLTRQFQTIDNAEIYADLILNSSKQYTDEIAFVIASSPLGIVPEVDLLRDNVHFLYENDKWIKYADIIDYDNGNGDYYSTLRYKVIENDVEKQFEHPKEIYYWYVVHPKALGENAENVYDKFWRDYLFNHNDLGYPLLKEKLSDIEYMWDCKSYSQPGNRLWTSSIEDHPTAIEAISYWIGKTVPHLATGDRPGQPNIIAHEHNGYCGELQRIAVAAQRTMLIPSIGACNIGEDHVWREFYERGWHQNDNWWADTGGCVDEPFVYADGWGKEMSALYTWRGDGVIYDVTPTYIHKEDRNTINFIVKDSYLQPVDGARVTATVVGIKDIMWIKNSVWTMVQNIWEVLPDIIKGKILQAIYDKIQEKIEEIPDVIDGLTVTTWNYTNIYGECSFELGKNHEYLFVIQNSENLRKPWQIAKNNAIRILKNSSDKTFHVNFLDFSNRIQKSNNIELNEGDCTFNIEFDTTAYQLHKNVRNDDIGSYDVNGKIDFFIVDCENFEKYKDGQQFDCYNYAEEEKAEWKFNADKEDWYIIFRNHAQKTNIILDFTAQVETATIIDKVQIVIPNTDIFDTPTFDIGKTIEISGIATEEVLLTIGDESIELNPENNIWIYHWNTTGLTPGEYTATAECSSAQDETIIELIDATPPNIMIQNPTNTEITENNTITISGCSWDNHEVKRVEVSIDDSEFKTANGTNNWFIEWDINDLILGDHTIYARAIDTSERKSQQQLSFVKNESGNDWQPEINTFYHTPETPTNVSNIIIYANVTTQGPFNIKEIVLFWQNETETQSKTMYHYAVNPVQERHIEDPYINESNNPIYGLELGQYPTSTQITYWIEAHDTADNIKKTDEQSFTIS